MHVLYFHQHFSTRAGATGTRSYEMARALLERGHQVTMVCGSTGVGSSGLVGATHRGLREGAVDGIRVKELCLPYSNRDGFLKRSVTFLRYAFRSVGIAWRTDYDLLFATSTPLTAGIPGMAMRILKPRKPFVFEVRDLWPELPRAMGVITNPVILRALSLLEWLIYRAADGCVGLAPGIVAGIRRRCARITPVEMIPNGCDLDLFRPVPAPRTSPPGTLRAVFTGAHGLANGLDAVLAAAAELKRRGRGGITLDFIGEGKLKADLAARAAREGLDNCRFRDPMPKHDLARALQEVDVCLMILADVPAFYLGTSPNKFFDYLACGLPVVNNYPGWLADLIKANECGVVVPPRDPAAFAAALIHLADHPEERQRMGQNARRLAERQFARDIQARRWVAFLDKICTEKKR